VRTALTRLLAYLAVVGLALAATLGFLRLGQRLEPGATGAVATAAGDPPAATDTSRLADSIGDPLALLLLQVVVIVVAARLMGLLFRAWRQPAVIGEMVAGILLGPSLLGWLWPASQSLLFPAASLDTLRLLSQLGVILFMFVVGIDVDLTHLRARLHTVIWVSHVSIVVPFCLGTGLALLTYGSLAPAGARFAPFALFLGITMSITAFPVLARILEERALARTSLGAIAIACAAVDDVTAWCLLGLVVAVVKADTLATAGVTVLLSLAFVVLLLGVVRPYAARWVPREVDGERRSHLLLAGVLSFLFLCALVTEVIGIFALFGAFLAGAALPRHPSIVVYTRKRLEAFSAVILLPLFFAYSGLRCEVGLLADARGWLLCLAVIAVAIAGKLGGGMLAARATGMRWADSFALGALMNTRGLVELIVLNLGYDLGILSPRTFAMLVLMALVTTFMTGPLLHVYERVLRREVTDGATAAAA
jgi:Kef-type K+ transport system membrane component KefB